MNDSNEQNLVTKRDKFGNTLMMAVLTSKWTKGQGNIESKRNTMNVAENTLGSKWNSRRSGSSSSSSNRSLQMVHRFHYIDFYNACSPLPDQFSVCVCVCVGLDHSTIFGQSCPLFSRS